MRATSLVGEPLGSKPLPGALLDRADPLARGLLMAWLFLGPGRGRPRELLRPTRAGTLVNNVTWGASRDGGGLRFFSTAQKTGQLQLLSDVPAVGQQFSVDFRMRVDVPHAGFVIGGVLNDANFPAAAPFRVHSPGGPSPEGTQLRIAVGNGATQSDLTMPVNGLPAGRPFHVAIAVRFAGGTSTATFWIDGRPRGSASAAVTPGDVATRSFRLGKLLFGDFDLTLEYVRVWRRPLAEGEARALAQAPYRMFRPWGQWWPLAGAAWPTVLHDPSVVPPWGGIRAA